MTGDERVVGPNDDATARLVGSFSDCAIDFEEIGERLITLGASIAQMDPVAAPVVKAIARAILGRVLQSFFALEALADA